MKATEPRKQAGVDATWYDLLHGRTIVNVKEGLRPAPSGPVYVHLDDGGCLIVWAAVYQRGSDEVEEIVDCRTQKGDST
jgi:hypothetical protein